MQSLLRSLLALFTLGMISTGCDKPSPPATPTDVTLAVPAMN
jgi:hypothetical protein